jgi:stress response protein YsnF
MTARRCCLWSRRRCASASGGSRPAACAFPSSPNTEERLLRETLRTERAEVERVPVGRELAEGEQAPVARREEDGTIVVPVLEEVLVVERRLVLREEIRLRLVPVEEPVEQPVTLRRQRAVVERLPPSGEPAA